MKLQKRWEKLAPEKRLHGLPVPVIGLTGGIATGKSTVTKIFREKGLPVIDADELVKRIYAQEETLQWLQTNHPEVMKGKAINFPVLREKFFSTPAVKDELEAFIYGHLPEAFRDAYKKLGTPEYVIYDVPLLFEKNLAPLVDVTVTVYAPEKVQLARLLSRDGHAEELGRTILKSQTDIEEKKALSDFVIDNSGTLVELEEEVNQVLRQLFSN